MAKDALGLFLSPLGERSAAQRPGEGGHMLRGRFSPPHPTLSPMGRGTQTAPAIALPLGRRCAATVKSFAAGGDALSPPPCGEGLGRGGAAAHYDGTPLTQILSPQGRGLSGASNASSGSLGFRCASPEDDSSAVVILWTLRLSTSRQYRPSANRRSS